MADKLLLNTHFISFFKKKIYCSERSLTQKSQEEIAEQKGLNVEGICI